jgi:hypothetical protein
MRLRVHIPFIIGELIRKTSVRIAFLFSLLLSMFLYALVRYRTGRLRRDRMTEFG